MFLETPSESAAKVRANLEAYIAQLSLRALRELELKADELSQRDEADEALSQTALRFDYADPPA